MKPELLTILGRVEENTSSGPAASPSETAFAWFGWMASSANDRGAALWCKVERSVLFSVQIG
jgi:hypothetical protein